MCRLLLSVLLLLLSQFASAAPAVAFFYGPDAPFDELKAFDIVVVEPDHDHAPERYRTPYSELYAYVSVGEAAPARSYFKHLPPGVILGENKAWQAAVMDLSHPAWPAFVADSIVAPLWARGYRGFFLDTLDSYRLAGQFDEAAQQQGLVRVIELLHQRFPGIRLILNRGFEIVPRVRDKIQMVAAESLFRGWNAARNSYVEVAEADRDWLLRQLQDVRDTQGLPVLAIDYVPPHDRARSRATAAHIQAAGIIPWVSDAHLETLGVGQREVVPRRLLMLYDGREAPSLHHTSIVRLAAMPLQHMGYVTEFIDINRGLPAAPQPGRIAGIVLWINGTPQDPGTLGAWLQKQIDAGIRVAAFGQIGLPLDRMNARRLGIAVPVQAVAPGPLHVVQQDPMLGFEAQPRPDRLTLAPLRVDPAVGRVLLQLADSRDARFDAAAIMSWGGFVLDPFAVTRIPGTEQERWVIDPFAFLAAALALPPLPVPDTTTENGRRLMFIHIDGDGFPSRAERHGAPIAGRVLLDEVIARYRLPTTMSVIEGEMSPQGLYPELAPLLEQTARDIFALPYVEIATHTYSHPFDWTRAAHGEAASGEMDLYHLDLKGYRVDLEREILGSADYIRQRLAPPGKPVQILLWSGDAAPEEKAMRLARQAGLLNMNGGNTIISRSYPSLTAVSPLGVKLGDFFQTYAPVMNENVYTNLWTGPFYGFAQVIETFTMTDTPRRLKPINIYYHSYSASKPAALNALHRVYGWALAQSPQVVFASDFIRKANGFNHVVLAREGAAWVVRGTQALRTLRAPGALGYPDPARSRGVAGFRPGSEGNYIHLAGEDTRLLFSDVMPSGPFLAHANARLTGWRRAGDTTEFTLTGHQPLEFVLQGAARCTVHEGRQPLRSVQGRPDTFHLKHAAATIRLSCPAP